METRSDTRARVWHRRRVFNTAFYAVFRGIFCTVLTVFASIFASLFGVPVFAAQPPRPPLTVELVEERIFDEVEMARALGFEEMQRDRLEDPSMDLNFSIAEGECVALIAGTWGPRRIQTLVVVPVDADTSALNYHDDARAAHTSIRGVVGHVQWCAEHAERVKVAVRTTPLTQGEHQNGQLVFMRTREGTRARNRGWVPREAP